jgi:hypothetical protein
MHIGAQCAVQHIFTNLGCGSWQLAPVLHSPVLPHSSQTFSRLRRADSLWRPLGHIVRVHLPSSQSWQQTTGVLLYARESNRSVDILGVDDGGITGRGPCALVFCLLSFRFWFLND